ncbi:hypothetical protein CAEBREN_24341 [Caenorhabditis brenneri]|uniref:Uncharacterized protein n=1 Tax=Caenorhabditis brenneri TaxID=135651 RepID=G0NGE5_CAEBE|nr:hypothetical protein CAEBREN_24341 [Caenorhabditis brenneri]
MLRQQSLGYSWPLTAAFVIIVGFLHPTNPIPTSSVLDFPCPITVFDVCPLEKDTTAFCPLFVHPSVKIHQVVGHNDENLVIFVLEEVLLLPFLILVVCPTLLRWSSIPYQMREESREMRFQELRSRVQFMQMYDRLEKVSKRRRTSSAPARAPKHTTRV